MRNSLSVLTLILCFPILVFSQTSVSGIINQYAAVTAFDTCEMSVSVTNPEFFKKNDRIFLFQAGGAIIASSNDDRFGDVTDMRSAGKFELNEIDSVGGGRLFLRFKFKNNYEISGGLQVISFPKYDNLVVSDTLKAKAWDGKSGGIIAFEATILTLNAPISATGVGFRGGAVKRCPTCRGGPGGFGAKSYREFFYDWNTGDEDDCGGQKGEGISPYIGGKDAGRGAQANGGGGGNNHKSGGGGGANIGPGGQGGIHEDGNCNGQNPGLGGKPLIMRGLERFFFGGGGGCGHNKDLSNSAGGNGGGGIFIKAATLNGNNQSIVANGLGAEALNGDGAGGGGAGGFLALEIATTNSKVRLEAKGGKGGDNGTDGMRDFGPGGGGGGGFIVYSNTTIPASTSAIGGVSGRNITLNKNADARAGSDGRAVLDANLKFQPSKDSVIRTINISFQPEAAQICDGQNTTLSVEAQGVSLKYQWFVSSGNNITALSENNTYQGTTTPTLTIKNAQSAELNPNFYYCVISSNCAAFQTATTARITLKIKSLPTPFFTFDKNNNTVSFKNGSSNATTYDWKFGDGKTESVTNPTHTYAVQDTYRVVLTAKNECGSRSFDTLINLASAPKAGFSAKTTNTCSPATLKFENESSDNVRKFFWTFPGGTPSTSSQAAPSVSYATSGTFDVVLVVENPVGRDTFIRKNYIRVNDKPLASFTNTKDGLKVQFTNTSTAATTYKWLFGNGDSSRAVNPLYTYKTAGTYIVRLEATNTCGTTVVLEQIVVFGLPTATVSTSRSQGCAPLIVDFGLRA
ncbi:MAG: PKD domain-containing protein [Saprospiraceae bacterium]|nr:PKD domain-containing protein [Saprospiraceae bacterium]